MIRIKKKREPNALLTYRRRLDLNPSYENMKGTKVNQIINGGSDDELYHLVLDSLAKEQGYICAYCMRKIPQKKVFPQMTIEHLVPQNATDTIGALDYKNMVAVCNGNRNKPNKFKTCDAKRGSLPIDQQTLLLNPTDPTNLTNLYYSSNGEIHSYNDDEDFYLKNVLGLNNEFAELPKSRKAALDLFQRKIYDENRGKQITKEQFRYYYDLLESSEKKLPYVGIILKWLEKKIS